MSRANVRVSEPSPDLQLKIQKAVEAVRDQKSRNIKCPYCKHTAFIVFEDSRGHIQNKCSKCGREIIFNVICMRRVQHFVLK